MIGENLRSDRASTKQFQKILRRSKTNLLSKILCTGMMCRSILCICVCQGWYSGAFRNQLRSCNEQNHHKFKIRQTAMPLPSLRCNSKLICVRMRPAQCQTIVPTFQWFGTVQVAYRHKYYVLRRNEGPAEAQKSARS